MSSISESKKTSHSSYHNVYVCSSCLMKWENDDDCTCNDRCPKCNTETEPLNISDTEIFDDSPCSYCDNFDKEGCPCGTNYPNFKGKKLYAL